MKKQILFFDLDRTLLDFSASERKGLERTFKHFEIPFQDDIYRWYLDYNDKLWGDYEDGLIPKNHIFECRFNDTFQHFGRCVDGNAMEAFYRTTLADGNDLIPDALFVLDTLSKTHRLFAATNGLASTQVKRVKDAGLAPYFENVFISEAMQLQKPMKEYFDSCFAQIDDFSKERSLLIGDSLASDIQGGINAGIDTCWFNPDSTANHRGIAPTYEIRKLTDLFQLLEVSILHP